MKRKLLSFCVLIVLIESFLLVVHSSYSVEIDATTVVSKVIDGDTFDTTSEGRIRLADVDTPERGESGYYEAKNFLTSLVYNKQVYLDIDDVYETDKYGRLVCVVYVSHNTTHFININKALLVEGYAVIWNFDNEFNPIAWSLYCPKEESPASELSDIKLEWFILAIIIVVVIAGTTAFLLYRKREPYTKPSHHLIK